MIVSNKLEHNPIVAVCGADDNYAMPLSVTLYSALVHLTGSTVILYIIDGGITEQTKNRIERVLDVEQVDLHLNWVSPQNFQSLSHLKTPGWVSEATYLRLLIPDVVQEHFQKAIYMVY